MEKIALFDAIIGVLSHFPGEQFRNDRRKIHSAFFDLRGKYPEYFGNLAFWKHSIFPKSKELDEIILSLTPGILSIKNPTYIDYTIDKDKAAAAWSDVENHEAHDAKIKDVAIELAKHLQ